MQQDRRWCPGTARRRLAPEIITAITMFEDTGDERRFGNVQGRTKSAGAWMRRSGEIHGFDKIAGSDFETAEG